MSLEDRFRELGLRRLPDSELTGTSFQSEVANWGQAYLGNSLFQGHTFATLLKLARDPSKTVYGFLFVDPDRWGIVRDYIDIPLDEPTPQDELIRAAHKTTDFGEFASDEYRKFATYQFNRDKLAAFMNRQAAGTAPESVTRWLRTTFDLGHLQTFGPVYVSSHGSNPPQGGYHYNVTIQNLRSPRSTPIEAPAVSAAQFARKVNNSISHISVNPLPVDTYLQDTQAKLKFLSQN